MLFSPSRNCSSIFRDFPLWFGITSFLPHPLDLLPFSTSRPIFCWTTTTNMADMCVNKAMDALFRKSALRKRVSEMEKKKKKERNRKKQEKKNERN